MQVFVYDQRAFFSQTPESNISCCSACVLSLPVCLPDLSLGFVGAATRQIHSFQVPWLKVGFVGAAIRQIHSFQVPWLKVGIVGAATRQIHSFQVPWLKVNT